MLLFFVKDVKRFMNILLKESLFDSYEARGVVLRAFTGFEIDCVSDEPNESEKIKYCLWGEIKPIVFELVKGKKQPRLLKVGICLSGDAAERIDGNAAALHMTFTYENGTINILTGTSQKKFTLDKSVDTAWDGFVTRMLDENGIETIEQPE